MGSSSSPANPAEYFFKLCRFGEGKSFPDNADLSDAAKVILSFKSDCVNPRTRVSLARCQETHCHPFAKRRTEKSFGKGGERGDRARERSGATPSPSPRFFPRRANPLPFPPFPLGRPARKLPPFLLGTVTRYVRRRQPGRCTECDESRVTGSRGGGGRAGRYYRQGEGESAAGTPRFVSRGKASDPM